MVTRQISVSHTSGGTGPFTFTFTSSNSNVTFSNVTGTAPLVTGTYTVTTDVYYTNQADISSAVISCTFVDTLTGCSKVLSPLVVDACSLQSTITNNGEFVFVTTTTGGTGSYTYEWNYDDVIFTTNSTEDSYLSLTIKEDVVVPTSTNISVLIKDSAGCELLKNYSYNFCKPTTTTTRIGLTCDVTSVAGCSGVVSQYRNLDLSRLVFPCSNQIIDWNTLTIFSPADVCVHHAGNGLITIASDISSNTARTITYIVKTTTGVASNTGTIVVSIPVCDLSRSFLYGIPQTIQLTIEDVVSDTRLLNVESRVSGTPDWSTFAFVGSPTWGTVALNANRDIVYTISNVATTPTIPDTITWTLNDYSGGQINITDTILRNRIALPTTVTETVCNSCGETTSPIDLLANDTGSIDRSTVQIVLNDPDIVITKDSDNNFIFTSLPGASFSNLSSYKVANIQGAYAPNQNFFVSVACVGSVPNPTLDLTCVVSKAFNIKDSFVNPNTFGDTFVETTPATPTYASQGGVISVGGDVDLTGLVNKTYTFQYTAQNVVACSPSHDDTGILTVVHSATPNINLSAATLVSAGVYSFTFTYSGIVSNFTVTDDGSPAVFHTGIVASGGSGSFILYAAAASSIVISATTQCGNNTTDTTVI